LTAQVSGSGYIPVDDDSIFYEWAGTGQIIILIHDGLLNRDVWDHQFATFSNNYKVVRYDRRGYGASSSATVPYTNLADLTTLFNHLEIEHAVLIGCSSGGALSIDFTLEFPQKVDALVLVGAVVGGFPYTSHMYDRGGHLPESFENEFEEGLFYILDDPYEIYKENSDAKEKALELFKRYPPVENRPQTYVRPEVPAFRRLNEITIPALILAGEFDIPDVHAHAGAINAGILHSKRVVVPKSGHLIPLEQPETFNQNVLEFLMDISR